VTCQRLPKLSVSDQLLLQPLEELGFTPQPVIWNDKKADWLSYDYLIPRSCWDYYKHIDDYNVWLTYLTAIHARVWNPVPVLRWNSTKKYLKDLEYNGVNIIPTVYITMKEKYFLHDIIKNKKWKHFVLKPAIGADGFEVSRGEIDTVKSSQKQLDNLLKKSDVLIQPLMNEAVDDGEYSLIFIGGNYSHAVLKRPKAGDFRSTYAFGGSVTTIKPSNMLIRQASRILEKLDTPTLYARVDGINVRETFMIMELELTEPYLYFESAPSSAMKFAKIFQHIASTL